MLLLTTPFLSKYEARMNFKSFPSAYVKALKFKRKPNFSSLSIKYVTSYMKIIGQRIPTNILITFCLPHDKATCQRNPPATIWCLLFAEGILLGKMQNQCNIISRYIQSSDIINCCVATLQPDIPHSAARAVQIVLQNSVVRSGLTFPGRVGARLSSWLIPHRWPIHRAPSVLHRYFQFRLLFAVQYSEKAATATISTWESVRNQAF